MEILGWLLLVAILTILMALPHIQPAEFEAAKPPLPLMEQYLGPAEEWVNLPLFQLAARFRDRGWDVKDTDSANETLRAIKAGRLERLEGGYHAKD